MDDASEEFKALEKKLNHDLDRDLDYFSSDIKKMIATEIIKRYYYPVSYTHLDVYKRQILRIETNVHEYPRK